MSTSSSWLDHGIAPEDATSTSPRAPRAQSAATTTSEPAAATTAAGPVAGAVGRFTGASAPQPTVRVPDAVDRLPLRTVADRAALWILGPHGGAGETTLARLLPGSRAADHAWPQPPPSAPTTVPVPLPLLVPLKVLLVARADVRGLTAAQHAATQWASGAAGLVELVGLVITADAPGRPPRPLRDLAAVVAGGVPRAWRLPWAEAWRLGEVTEKTSPKEVRRLVADLHQLVPALAPALTPSPAPGSVPVPASDAAPGGSN